MKVLLASILAATLSSATLAATFGVVHEGWPGGGNLGAFVSGYDVDRNRHITTGTADVIFGYGIGYTGTQPVTYFRITDDVPFTLDLNYRPGEEYFHFSSTIGAYQGDAFGGSITYTFDGVTMTDHTVTPALIFQVDEPSGLVPLIMLMLILAYLTVPRRRRALLRARYEIPSCR